MDIGGSLVPVVTHLWIVSVGQLQVFYHSCCVRSERPW